MPIRELVEESNISLLDAIGRAIQETAGNWNHSGKHLSQE
jgi:hypothetical protein